MTDTAYVPDRHAFRRTGSCLYCDAPVLARRLCSRHYNQWWRHGRVELDAMPLPGPWLCETSDLDFMTRQGTEWPMPITGSYSRNHARDFKAQLVVCARCTTREECAELGETEHYGIWGGTLPHERGYLK